MEQPYTGVGVASGPGSWYRWDMSVRTVLLVLTLAAACPAPAGAGLYVGVVRAVKGLVVVDSTSSPTGPRRVTDVGRVELGDLVRIGEGSSAELLTYEGSRVLLEANSDYRIDRDALLRQLDGGDIVARYFRLRLGAKTQTAVPGRPPEPIAMASSVGRPFVRGAEDEAWTPLGADRPILPGDVVRCDDGATAAVLFKAGGGVRLTPGTLAWLHADGIHLERGGGLVSLRGASRDLTVVTPMALIEPRRDSVFRVEEERGGCRIHVLAGAVTLKRKSQGVAARTTVGAGQVGGLTRAGVVQQEERFLDGEASVRWADEVATLVAAGASAPMDLRLTALFAGAGAGASPAPSSPPPPAPVPPRAEEKTGAGVPPAPSPAPSPAPGPPASAEELENLFQLPRLGGSERHQARP